MITAGQFKKRTVITFEGVHWIVEDYHIQKTAQRRPVLQTKLRSMKTGHIVERAFDEGRQANTWADKIGATVIITLRVPRQSAGCGRHALGRPRTTAG